MLMMKAIVVFHLTVVCSLGASAAESPLVIENSHLLLRFDAGTRRLDRPGRQACGR